MLEKFTAPITLIGGSSRIGDPAAYAFAAAAVDETLGGKDGGMIAVIVPDQSHLEYWTRLTRFENFIGSHNARTRFLVSRDGWTSGRGGAVGASDAGAHAIAFKPETLIIVDHPDDRPEGWAWCAKVAKAKRTIVLNTTYTGQPWRLFSHDESELPELSKCTLASDDKSFTLTVTGTSWRPDENAPEFDSGIPLTADFKGTKAAKLPDLDKWRKQVESAQAEAEQDEARRWFEAFRQDPDTIPPALAKAAPWLHSDNKKA